MTPTAATDQELLKRAQLHPVFDEDGNLVGISQLKVETDRRLGVQAMRDLHDTVQPHDDIVAPDGWTMKQKRILRQRAPYACHYLRASRKWDAAANAMAPSVTIMLPFEVVWTLFDLLFDGQYSIEVTSLESDSEEVMPVGEDPTGAKADDVPGRVFYARAVVRLTIHLANGQTRAYEGLGASFGELPMGKTGNVYAINNARRTAEKGAVSDAKREALSTIGAVFRRAFEDGDEMIETIERLLTEQLQERNRPAIHSAQAVPTPSRRRGPKTPAQAPATQPSNERPPSDVPNVAPAPRQEPDEPADAEKDADASAAPGVEGSDSEHDPRPSNSHWTTFVSVSPENCIPVDVENFLEEFIDIAIGHVETPEELDNLVERNEATLKEYVPDRSEIDKLRASLDPESGAAGTDAQEDGIPDFDEPSSAFIIDADDKSGKQVLDAMKDLLSKASSASDIDSVISSNGAAIRKMTARQMNLMLEHRTKVEAKLKN